MIIAILILVGVSIFGTGTLSINDNEIDFNWFSLAALVLLIIFLIHTW